MIPDQPVHDRLSLLTLALLALLASTSLGAPLNGDTAVFQVGAQHLLDGAVLYRDWWDLKGPGVYLVHALSIALFTASALGLHLLAMLVLLTVAASLPPFVRGALLHPRLAALAGLLAVAPYYLVAGEWHLSQPAVFAGAALYGGYRGLTTSRPATAVLGGMSLAAAISIKLSALAPAVALVATAFALQRRHPHVRPALVLGGLVAGAALFVAWLWWRGGLGGFWWTHATWRQDAAVLAPGHGLWRVGVSTWWYVAHHAGLLVLAALGAFAALQKRRASDPCFILAVVWVAAGYVGVGLERFAAWPFDLFLVSIPVGILALAGIDAGWARLLQSGARPAPTVAVALAVVLLPFAPALVDRLSPPAEVAESRAALRETRERLATEPPGPIYVFGDPRHLLVSGRPMATSVHGWAWELQPDSMWERLYRELREEPPGLVLIDAQYSTMMRERHPELWEWFRSSYRMAWQSRAGAWYARR